MTNAAVATSRLLAYARVSTDEQATTGVSLSAQQDRIESYVRLYGGELVDVVVDAGVSAKTLRRPGLERLLQQLDEGDADGVVVAKLDRLTRSVRDLGDLVEKYFAEGRFVLLSVGEQIDTRSAGGRLVLNLLASVSQWEREAIGERTRVALQHLQAQGAHIGSAPFGRAWTATGELVPVDDEIETVQLVRQLRHEGLSLREIADRLTADGRKTKRGGRWYPSTIRNVLSRAA